MHHYVGFWQIGSQIATTTNSLISTKILKGLCVVYEAIEETI